MIAPLIARIIAEESGEPLHPDMHPTGNEVTSPVDKSTGDSDNRRYFSANQGISDENGLDDGTDNDRQGVIRTVPDAHLIYKREQPDGTFEELWIYNVEARGRNALKSQDIRNAILAGTDIPVGKMVSEDGTQTAESWAVSNAELLQIQGLIN